MKKLRRAAVLSGAIACMLSMGQLYGQSGVYDRAGIIPGHGTYSSLPGETVDLFTGNLTLAFRDILLPGPNGLNIEVWRVYNSKVLQDRQQSQPNPTVQAYPKSMVGIGWTMHMGIVHQYSSSTPIIEFPDGRRETAFPDNYGTQKHITRDFLKYDKGIYPIIDPKLYFKNGVIWTFGNTASLPRADGSSETVLMVTRIQDAHGNYIEIEYDPNDSYRSIKTISDNMEREVRFVKSYQGSNPAKLAEIRIRNYDDSHDVVYSYSVDSFPNGYYKLVSFAPPELPNTTFVYNDGLSYNYELIRLTSCYGGELEFSFQNHDFYFNNVKLDSRVVNQKRIVFNPGEQAKIWNYNYPTYQGVSSGTATVQGPEFSTEISHYAYDNSYPWRIGLESSRSTTDGAMLNTNVWTCQQITTTSWSVLGTNMGTAKGPLPSSVTQNRTGDATLKTQYYYDRSWPKKYGLPSKLGLFVNDSGSAKAYKEFTYYFETRDAFKVRYLLFLQESEKEKSASGTTLTETLMSYYDEDGKWGTVKQMKRWKAGTTYYTWDFTYNGSDPKNISITVDGPGGEGISQVLYRYGVEASRATPDFIKFDRTISKYSYILYEQNQYDGELEYIYDDLGRVTSTVLSGTFNPINVEWLPNSENKAIITQGQNIVTKCWDGMGRNTGHTESCAGTTLFYRKTLDAEGRAKEKSSGSVDPAHKYSYLLDAAGRVTQVTTPTNESSTISYSGIILELTNPEGHTTLYEYNDLPGLPTKLTDAQNRMAIYTYDAIGRLKVVVYNALRSQSYEYDGLHNVTSETHPETGTISYSFDSSNRLSVKSWGGNEQHCYYNASGQLTSVTGAETVVYGYDDENGNPISITGSSGWSRSGFSYNQFGSLEHEVITIPGLTPKSINYGYDNNNNLKTTTYPDGNVVDTPSNGLNRPESLTFNETTLIENVAYGPNKMIASMDIAENGTTFASTFFSNGAPNTASLMRGSTPLYNVTYTYDGAGNINGISSQSPAPALNATFDYDSLNRLTSAIYSTGDMGNPRSYDYEYDAYGNILTVRHDTIIAFNKTYDSYNRTVGYQYDSRGNLISAEGKNYVWDAQNRLRAITDASAQFVAEYTYDDRGLRIATLEPKPDIDIVGYPDESNADFVSGLQSPSYKTFTVFNRGYGNLNLGSLTIAGQNPSMFSVYQQPGSPVLPGQSTQFVIRFQPSSGGDSVAELLIVSDDPDDDPDSGENPYIVFLRGYCVPDIEIGGVGNGGTFDFGTVTVGESRRDIFVLLNAGTATLLLYGAPALEQSGGGFDFYLEEEGDPVPSSIAESGSAAFAVRFAPTGEGQRMATLTVNSSDPDENPYTITLVGTGLNGTQKIVKGSELTLLSPDGGETLEAGSFRDIRWTGGEDTKCVKVEYSTNNGSAYHTIADRIANIGSFPWKVPEDMSGSCLVRISDADGAPALPLAFSFEFKFRISSTAEEDPSAAPHFVFRAGIPDPTTQTYQVADVVFAPDGLRGRENLIFNQAMGGIQKSERFFGNWHYARITYDMTNYTGSVWVDNEPVLSNVPLKADLDIQSQPEISVSRDQRVPVTLWIDDMDVGFIDQSLVGQDMAEVVFKPLFRESFNRYESALFPRQGGWLLLEHVPSEEKVRSDAADEGLQALQAAQAEGTKASFGIDDWTYASSAKSFKLEGSEDEPATVLKRFSLPERVPYCVSAEPFAIVAPGEVRRVESGRISKQDGEKDLRRQKRRDDDASRGERRRAERRETGISRPVSSYVRREASQDGEDTQLMAGSPVSGMFYIYSFDNRLLAEYDVNGQLVRDYIYLGSQLVAEYRGSQFFYYASDQIDSTRIVTDSNGTIVYSRAHDPYGGIQKTWVSTYDPSLKYSGKQRDAESELDYFGARYYDRAHYRFLSVDPVLSYENAVSNPQRWSLYSYCVNNPISGVDPDGRDTVISIFRIATNEKGTSGMIFVNGQYFGVTSERPYIYNLPFVSSIPAAEYSALIRNREDLGYDVVQLNNVKGREGIQIHPAGRNNYGCVGMLDRDKFNKMMADLQGDKSPKIEFPADGGDPTFSLVQNPIGVRIFDWYYPILYEPIPEVTYTVVVHDH